jgi:hypothetical protein
MWLVAVRSRSHHDRHETTEGDVVMSKSVLDRLFVNVLGLAEQHLRAEGRIAPLLYFSGPGGEAVLRLDLTPAADRQQLIAKARLMATALAAEACVWLFEARLRRRGEPSAKLVAVLGEDRGGNTLALAEVADEGEGRRLRRIPTPLATAAGADAPSPLARFIHRDSRDYDPAEGWRQLEAMGVNRSDGRRPLH